MPCTISWSGTKSSSYRRRESKFLRLAAACDSLHAHQNDRYAAVTVDHSDDVPCSGRFILHQGIQRRIGITLCHESGSELIWKDVQEVVIGKTESP